jgi:hypothetical protein
LIPGTRGIATASDFIINGGSNRDFNLLYQQLIPRETRYGGVVKVNFDVTDYLTFYDYLIVQRNEELSSFQNQAKAMAVRLLTTISLPAPFKRRSTARWPVFNPFVDESVAGDPNRAFYNGSVE